MQVKNRQSNKQRQTNANYTAWSKLAVAQHWALKSLQENRRLVYALMLLPASLLLSGCKTVPQALCEQPAPVSRPVPLYQIPSVSYSLQAQTDIETWRLKLINAASTSSSSSSLKPTSGISKPSSD